jgi:hypothetical protein
MDTLSFDVDSFFASSQEIKRDMSEEEERPVTASSKRKGMYFCGEVYCTTHFFLKRYH